MDVELPPSYALTSPASPAPLYSERPSVSERVLQTERHPTGLAPAVQEQKHIYKTDHLEVRLHPPHWGLALPAYGLGGTIDGVINFCKSCSHVVELSVSLQGAINTSASQHATVAVPGVSRVVILKKKQVVFTAPAKQSATLKGEFPFAIQFPTYLDGQHDPLPPSYTVYQPGISTEIHYSFRVDISRKGMRRHEKLVVPLLYLPKSRPETPPVDELPWAHTDAVLNSERMSNVTLKPTWLPRQDPNAHRREDLPRISLTMAATKCFASGDTIAILLKIESPRSPALARLLSHNAHLSLVKRQKTWISLGAQISIREQCLSRADLYLADESQEGIAYLRLEVQAGESGRETSWRVKDAVAVEHAIRLIILPPEHLKDFPVYRHEIPIMLTTDQYGTLQSESLILGGIPFPALGLNDVHRYLRADI
ncbi:hypothetical protein BD309DRAFT_879131 [Dichomitus squalens]|uniref:Uncharacterized protein n=1 Tax=Dichomitus squalens TaxID=114155 RepID=A0A4Q9QE63_9APHY|nr:uncharacterized protein DICSQDRAFT_97108 [Dichomitus squalens LYAD-421 SS1]EJF65713.1 hypothetical protein DICSQDRAFT_97108 [Dichomitus squalens LYAD-421 SS1]TBU50606.1 hypothetical protein BD309DRAFT_879131 [Dichomitus squalens]TBU66005.1 hypothetical protein BD310DRAFT_865317 [Dichomitus squalens]